MTSENNWRVGGYAAFTLYVAAAFNDATISQRVLLRTKCRPMLARMRELENDDHNWPLAAKSLLMRIHQVMGNKWLPEGEWSAYINALLKEE